MGISFGSKVNRSYSMYLPFRGDHITANVYFHKTNTYLGFTTDHNTTNMVRDHELTTKVYKDLYESSFASTFLDIKDYSSDTLDIRRQFSNVLGSVKDKIQYVGNETIKLSKHDNPNDPRKPLESSLYIYAFTFSNYVDDFIYFLAERQHIDVLLGKKLVRTCGFQISTPAFNENLTTMVRNFSGKSGREKRGPIPDTSESLKDLFPDKDDVNVRKF